MYGLCGDGHGKWRQQRVARCMLTHPFLCRRLRLKGRAACHACGSIRGLRSVGLWARLEVRRMALLLRELQPQGPRHQGVQRADSDADSDPRQRSCVH